MTATAKLFMHGRSQAVCLPKEFRFEGTEVRVSKVGDKVVLEPLKKRPFDAWFARLDELGGRDFLPDGIPDDPPAEPDPRIFFDEWSVRSAPMTVSSRLRPAAGADGDGLGDVMDPADEPASVLLARLKATGSTVPARRGRTGKGS